MTDFLKIKREKYKSLQIKSVTTSPGLPYSPFNDTRGPMDPTPFSDANILISPFKLWHEAPFSVS